MANQFIKFSIKVPREEVTKTLKILKQRGSSHLEIDRARSAMLPGKRVTAHGTEYWESRKNRSDQLGKKV